MSGINNCDTPGCTAEREVVTPSGYVCRECADKHADDVLLADGGDWHQCDACGAEYRDGKAAVQCCADRLSEDGERVMTDGGREQVGVDAEADVRQENVASGVSITAKLKRGTGTRDQDEIKVKAKGTTADEARANMERVLPAVESWADALRGVQPDDGGDSA